MSQLESGLWLPHSWPLRWPTAIVCFWPSVPQLWRHQRSVSRPCFCRIKWKVHNPLLIAVPRVAEQPQLNTGQSGQFCQQIYLISSWVPLFPKECYQIFLPQCPIHFDTSCQAPRIVLFTLAKWQEVDLNNTCVNTFHSSPLAGTVKVFAFYFPSHIR